MTKIYYFCVIMSVTANINTLRRYKLIQELYLQHKNEDIPTTRVLRKHIYPTYPISRKTLYKILETPVDKLLKEAEAGMQISLF